MAKEAEAHAGEDKEKREEIESRNQLDSLVYQVEKMFRENGDKVSGEERGAVETALADAKSTLAGTPDAAALKAAHEKLQASSYKLAEAMYKTCVSADGRGRSGCGYRGCGTPRRRRMRA